MNTILADKLDNRKGYAHDNVIDNIKNKKDSIEQLLAEHVDKEQAQKAAQEAQTAAQHEFGRLKGIIDPASAAVTVVSRVDMPHTDPRSLSPTRWVPLVNRDPPTKVPPGFFNNILNNKK